MSIEGLVQEYMQRLAEEAEPWLANWGLWAIGAGILCETLLFAGVIIPGFSILVTAGFMSAQGLLNPWATLACALAGGVIGDQTAYVLGRLMGDRLLAKHHHTLAKVRYALTHEGGYILLWYHYVSPLRIVMPYLAGSLRYPRLRWLLFDTLGLALWVAFAFSLGFFSMGPLKRFGDLGYYVLFGAIVGMIVFGVWRVIKLLTGKLTAEQIFAEEVEMAGKVMERGRKRDDQEPGLPETGEQLMGSKQPGPEGGI